MKKIRKAKIEGQETDYTQEPSGTSMKIEADIVRKAECKDGDHLGS